MRFQFGVTIRASGRPHPIYTLQVFACMIVVVVVYIYNCVHAPNERKIAFSRHSCDIASKTRIGKPVEAKRTSRHNFVIRFGIYRMEVCRRKWMGMSELVSECVTIPVCYHKANTHKSRTLCTCQTISRATHSRLLYCLPLCDVGVGCCCCFFIFEFQ